MYWMVSRAKNLPKVSLVGAAVEDHQSRLLRMVNADPAAALALTIQFIRKASNLQLHRTCGPLSFPLVPVNQPKCHASGSRK